MAKVLMKGNEAFAEACLLGLLILAFAMSLLLFITRDKSAKKAE